MKKYLLLVVVFFTVSLAGCVPTTTNSNQVTTTYTEDELKGLIEQLMPDESVNTTYDLSSFQDAITNMVATVRTGVLGVINNNVDSTSSATGSGVIYKKEGGYYYLVTNDHVIDNYSTLQIVYEKNGMLFEIDNDAITVVGADVTTDLAVLKFSSSEDFAVIQMADSYSITPGEFVFAIGNPLGFDYYGTVTMGVISGTARYVSDGTFDATLLQHDAAISPGNSGGALVNINGELVGINNMKIVQDNVSNIGFAIPSNTVKRIVADLEDDGIVTRPYLGIQANPYINDCGLDYGVCVIVQEGGAAQAAGLEDNDVIIGYKNQDADTYLTINNFNDLREAILNSYVGEKIQIKYVRDGVEYVSPQTALNVHPDDQ